MLGTAQPSYWTQPLGVTFWVVVPHLLRVANLSKNALPRLVATKVSESPWKAMMATGSLYFSLKGMTPVLPEQGATARNTSNSKGSVYDIMPPKLNPVEK